MVLKQEKNPPGTSFFLQLSLMDKEVWIKKERKLLLRRLFLRRQLDCLARRALPREEDNSMIVFGLPIWKRNIFY